MLLIFETAFYALTGRSPYLWQKRLFNLFMDGIIPPLLDAPTSVGKTKVITIWLIALAIQVQAKKILLPRRLVCVINRRAVVDQATKEVVEAVRNLNRSDLPEEISKLRDALRSMSVLPSDRGETLAVSTLRGELADNREWQADQSKPAIIIGTVDMIGSKLLFRGYGTSYKLRGHVAGILGHDTLVIHDENQLSPAFGALVRYVSEATGNSIRMMEMSATPNSVDNAFRLNEEELDEEPIWRRVRARKVLQLHGSEDLVRDLIGRALTFQQTKSRVLVYTRSPEDALKVCEGLRKALKDKHGARVGLLTGIMRCFNRDLLTQDGSVLSGFLARGDREDPSVSTFLVATSAGENGIDLDGDHEVMDLACLDSIVQRVGRGNRTGRSDGFTSQVHVFYKTDESSARLLATKVALQRLPVLDDGFDASPVALTSILDTETRATAFSEVPRVVPLTDIVIDALSMTSIREPFGESPRLPMYLHGVGTDPPEALVVWRVETNHLIELIKNDEEKKVAEWFAKSHPIRTREQLRDKTFRVAKELNKLRSGQEVLIMTQDGNLMVEKTGNINKDKLSGCTLILPTSIGGMDTHSGMLDSKSTEPVLDVADWTEDETHARARVLITKTVEGWGAQILGHRMNCPVVPVQPSKEAAVRSVKVLLGGLLGSDNLKPKEDVFLLALNTPKSPDTWLDSPTRSELPQTLVDHLRWTGEVATRLGARLGLDPTITEAVYLAAVAHDLGKDRALWQASIHNQKPNQHDPAWIAKAKSEGDMDWQILKGYRHEFGSLLDVDQAADDLSRRIQTHPERDLILHLIATHHGRARPHFERSAYDWEAYSLPACDAEALQVMYRYASLQRRFGHWKLAWLEGLLKTADVIASRQGREVETLP